MMEIAETELARASHAAKGAAVEKIHETLKTAKLAIVTDYRGLTVAQMTKLRSEIRQASGEYQVIKNTLAKRALKGTSYGGLEKLLEGPNGWVFAYDDPVELSKVLVKFVDDNENLTIRGGVFEGQFMEPASVKELAKMPSKPELQAKLLALINAPATQLVRLIQEPGARVARLLDQVRQSKSE